MSAAELYVYYKLPATQAAAARAALAPAWAGLHARWPQLQSRLLQREAPAADGLLTWMEIHRPAAGMPAAWEQDLTPLAEALAPWLAGARHTERFRAF